MAAVTRAGHAASFMLPCQPAACRPCLSSSARYCFQPYGPSMFSLDGRPAWPNSSTLSRPLAAKYPNSASSRFQRHSVDVAVAQLDPSAAFATFIAGGAVPRPPPFEMYPEWVKSWMLP